MQRKSFGKVVCFWGALLSWTLTLAGCIPPGNSPVFSIFLMNIAIANPPEKDLYAPDEDADWTGLAITAQYNDGSIETITYPHPYLDIQGFEKGQEGGQTISVSFSGKTATFNVTVIDPNDTTPPGVASDLAASPGDRQVSLSWTNPTDSDFHHVEITYTNGSLQTLTVNKTADPNNSKVITDLTNGEEYTFAVKTVDAAGNKSSEVSVSATPVDTTPPAEAGSLTAMPSSNQQVTLIWTNPPDSDFHHVEIAYTNGTPQTLTVNKTADPNNSAVITGLTDGTEYAFTLKTVDEAGNESSEITLSVTPGLMPFPAKPDIAEKFGYDSPSNAAEVTAVFNALHDWLEGLADADALADSTAIALGNYIDLPALAVEGYGTEPKGAFNVFNTDLGGAKGKLLRLIVIGKNSYSGINGNGETKHLVFHFQNFPAGRRMNPNTQDVAGYAESEMRKYLTPVVGDDDSGKFLAGLVDAGVPDSVFFAPQRKVSLLIVSPPPPMSLDADSSSLQSVTDKLFLLTEAEMLGPRQDHPETSSNQASFLGYYNSASKCTKYNTNGSGQPYWLATFFTDNASIWKFCNVNGSGAYGDQDQLANQGIAPAFCVK
jgi:hypothetical protein